MSEHELFFRQTLIMHGECCERHGCPDKAKEAYEKAKKKRNIENLEANESLNNSAQAHLDNLQGLELLAQAKELEKNVKYQSAMETYEKAKKLFEKAREIETDTSRIHIYHENRENARIFLSSLLKFEQARQTLETDQEDISALIVVAEFYCQKEKYKEAAKCAEKILQLAPEEPDALNVLGLVASQKKTKRSLAQAIKYFTKAYEHRQRPRKGTIYKSNLIFTWYELLEKRLSRRLRKALNELQKLVIAKGDFNTAYDILDRVIS